jgi:hypothetical protein
MCDNEASEYKEIKVNVLKFNPSTGTCIKRFDSYQNIHKTDTIKRIFDYLKNRDDNLTYDNFTNNNISIRISNGNWERDVYINPKGISDLNNRNLNPNFVGNNKSPTYIDNNMCYIFNSFIDGSWNNNTYNPYLDVITNVASINCAIS